MSEEDETWEIARQVCTEAELRTLRVRERLANRGMPHGYRSIGLEMGVSTTTIRDRIRNAEAKIAKAQEPRS